MNFVLFLGILLFLGLISTRLMKILKMPNVTGYLVVGLIASIVCIIFDNYISSHLTDSLSELNTFISAIALGFIALSIGEEFKIEKLKSIGPKVMLITILQALAATVLVDIAVIIVCISFKLNISIAICLGAIATATAPAATLMVIHQYDAKGPLVDILLPVVAADDAIGLVIFSISSAISKTIVTNSPIGIVSVILLPLLDVFGSLLIGFILGLLMHYSFKLFKSRNNHMVIIITYTILGVGLCQLLNTFKINNESLDFSNLLCCMMIGAVYVNLTKTKDQEIFNRDTGLIDRWTVFLFMLFFVLSGCHLGISANEILKNSDSSYITMVLIILLVYLVARSLGKYFGSYFGCKITHQTKNITNYLGITLLPQAGVAIGMANAISQTPEFQINNIGNIIVTVVLIATLVYEMVGPLLTKWSLVKTGEIKKENE